MARTQKFSRVCDECEVERTRALSGFGGAPEKPEPVKARYRTVLDRYLCDEHFARLYHRERHAPADVELPKA